MKNKKNLKYMLLAFFMPIIIYIIIYLIKGINLNGEDFLISDFKVQYISIFSYFKDVLTGKQSILYSFNNLLGSNMISTFSYYLTSPFNLLLCIFSKANIPFLIMIINLIRFGLCSLFMYIFLKEKINSNSALIFSLCYSMMAYLINYMFNIMWLDSILITPLVLLGIDILIDKENSILYIIMLSLCIIFNYYIGYMVCIFSLLYFLWSLFSTKRENNKKIVLNFILSSMLALMLTAFIIIPNLYNLMQTSKFSGTSNYNINIDIVKIIARFFIGSNNYSNIINTEYVNVYCGIIIFPLMLFYFTNKKIEKRKKICTATLFAIFLISICFNKINIIWHGFNYPNSLNYRFSFLMCLFILFISFESFNKCEKINLKSLIIGNAIFIIISILLMFSNINILSFKSIIISNIFLLIYNFLFYFLYNKKKIIVKYLIYLLIIIELGTNLYMTILYKKNNISYENYVNKGCINYYDYDKSFYRIGGNVDYTYLDSMVCGYNGITTFLSTMNKNTYEFFKNIGYGYNSSLVIYNNISLPIVDSILGVKYVSLMNEDSLYYNLYKTKEIFNIKINTYKNNNSLGLGFMTNYTKIDNKDYNVFEYQNYLMNSLLDNKTNYYYPIEIKEDNNSYIINSNQTVYLYNDISNIENNELSVKIDDLLVTFARKSSRYYMLKNRGNYFLDYSNNIYQPIEILAYKFDYKLFNEDIKKLSNSLNVIEEKGNYIKTRINVGTYNTLFTSIPYDEGWNIYVDGKKTKYFKIFDTFIGLNLENGNHIIEFKYMPRGLLLGISISVTSLIILFIYIINKFHKK